MAQLGSALDWGSRGRGFKSRQPDDEIARTLSVLAIFVAHPRATTTWTPTRTACEPPVSYVGRLFRTWAGMFAARCRTLLEREPALPHVGRLFRMWAWLPRLGIAG